MAWHGYYYFGFIIIGCYLGAIVTAAFSEKLSTTLMMLYLGGLFVVVLGGMAWFAFMLVASASVWIQVAVAAYVVWMAGGVLMIAVGRMRWKRQQRAKTKN